MPPVMRVPDISSTAGYAGAPFTQAKSSQHSNSSAGSHTINAHYSYDDAAGRSLALNKNGNFDDYDYDLGLQESRSLYRQTAFASSADEFVQKALSSSPAESTAAATGSTTNRRLPGFDSANCNAQQKNSSLNPNLSLYKRSDSDGADQANDLNDLDDTGNTYRSFKEVFNINKALFEGCVKDFENIDTIENSNLNLSDTELDPILIINSQLKNDSYNNGTSSSSSSYPYEFCISPTDHLDMKKNNVEQVVAKTPNFDQHSKPEDFNNCVEQRFENDSEDLLHEVEDYEDQSMIDLCNDGTKSTYDNDDRDEYLTSPTSSSSVSLRTSKRSYFPRGIINPNYPGFQHLAHTLSEHFIGNNSVPTSESYDSDMSEYEMELSADSFEDLPEEELRQQQQQMQLKTNLKNNNFNKNFNNNNNNINNNYAQSLNDTQPSAAFIKMANGGEYTSKLDITTIAYSADTNHNTNSEMDINDLPVNLETVLTLLEPPMYVEENATKLNTKKLNPQNTVLHKPLPACITPDILIKNPTCRNLSPLSKKKENRPDLLRGVSPQPVRITSAYEPKNVLGNETKPKSAAAAAVTLNTIPYSTNNTSRTVDLTKDEISLGITPVDIIGDFGREVEREFGLLVSGYRRLVDGCVEVNEEDEVDDDDEEEEDEDEDVDEDDDDVESAVQQSKKVTDAMLSSANDQIDSKFLAVYKQRKDDQTLCDKEEESELADSTVASIKHIGITNALTEFLEEGDNNAVDWSCTSTGPEPDTTQQHHQYIEDIVEGNKKSGDGAPKPKYQKSSYDDRQLPPVAIDYKRCQLRTTRKPQNLDNPKGAAASSSTTVKVTRNHVKPTSFANRFLHTKRGFGGTGSNLKGEKAERKREEAELNQYQQLISEKELILSNSRYAKMSSWAQYLKNSVNDRKGSADLISPSALDLFDAYRIGTEIDMETLQQHMKMAKEIEKKRRSDREEIRRRLAMGAEPSTSDQNDRQIWKPTLQSRIQNGVNFCRANEASSDTESHSSDSETCPKLSKTRHQQNLDIFDMHASVDKSAAHPYKGRPLSVSCTNNNKPQQQQQGKPQQQQQLQLSISNEDKECDFFTKQARLQIEARMALAQAKEMAHMQMEIDRQNQRVSPITAIIRGSLEKVGVRMTVETRRVSRQMLTEMNIAQLQVLVNSLHSHIEDLNESLVHILMERDDLHMGQDAMLVDIEELTRYIGAKEQIAQQDRKTVFGKRSK